MTDCIRFEIDPMDCAIEAKHIGGNKSKPVLTLRVYAELTPENFEKISVDMFFYGKARDMNAEILKELGWNADFKNPQFGECANDHEKNPFVLEPSQWTKNNGEVIDCWRIIRKQVDPTEKDLEELSAIFKSY